MKLSPGITIRMFKSNHATSAGADRYAVVAVATDGSRLVVPFQIDGQVGTHFVHRQQLVDLLTANGWDVRGSICNPPAELTVANKQTGEEKTVRADDERPGPAQHMN